MDYRTLHDALESSGRLGIVGTFRDQVFKFGFEIVDQTAAQLVEVDTACAHHGGGIRVIDQRKQQMFERRILMMPLVCDGKRTVQGLFKALRESRHSRPLMAPAISFDRLSSGSGLISSCNLFVRTLEISFGSHKTNETQMLLLFHHALQRMLMFSGKVHHLSHFGFGDLVGKNATFADAMMMHMQHDRGRGFNVLVEELL